MTTTVSAFDAYKRLRQASNSLVWFPAVPRMVNAMHRGSGAYRVSPNAGGNWSSEPIGRAAVKFDDPRLLPGAQTITRCSSSSEADCPRRGCPDGGDPRHREALGVSDRLGTIAEERWPTSWFWTVICSGTLRSTAWLRCSREGDSHMAHFPVADVRGGGRSNIFVRYADA